MSISKLLMTAAVCTMSVTAVSTSYGSEANPADGEMSPSAVRSNAAAVEAASPSPAVRRLTDFDGSASTVDLGAASSLRRRGSDSMSQSQMSSMSTVSDEALHAWLTQLISSLDQAPSSVTLPNGSAAVVGQTKFDIVRIAVQNLVAAYNKKDGRARLIAARLQEQQGQALTESETKADQAERSAVTWKNRTIVISAVLTAVTGVLLNVARTHGLKALFGK